MLIYVLRRLLQLIPLLAVISFVSFFILEASPGSYFDSLKGNPTISPETVRQLEIAAGENLPFLQKYLRWCKRVVVGKSPGINEWSPLGNSLKYKRPVHKILTGRFFATFILAFSATVIAWGISVPLGIICAVKQYSLVDKFFSFLAFLGLSIPSILSALLLLYFAAASGEWLESMGIPAFPIGGMYGDPEEFSAFAWYQKALTVGHHLLLPALAAGTLSIAGYLRHMRGSLLETLTQDYVRTAKAKGLSPRAVIWKHAVRNAINPMVTLFGYSLAGLLSSSVVVEVIMNWPGLANLIVDAINSKDTPLVMGSLLISAVLLVLGNLVADVLLALVDPRIKLG